jgi:hypothetical protein
MDIELIYKSRQTALANLIDAHGGKASEFARQYGLDENRVRQLLTRHRNFGEKAARQMEDACGLPPFYFDMNGTDQTNKLNAYLRKLDDSELAEIIRHCQILSERHEKATHK